MIFLTHPSPIKNIGATFPDTTGKGILLENRMIKQKLRTQQLARQLASDLRKNMTETEQVLWNKLRSRQFMGFKFLNQHPLFYNLNNRVKFFIADFYCHQIRLVIEVDGGIHETQEDYDILRSELLATKNIRVARIKNVELGENINKVLIRLKKQINKI